MVNIQVQLVYIYRPVYEQQWLTHSTKHTVEKTRAFVMCGVSPADNGIPDDL